MVRKFAFLSHGIHILSTSLPPFHRCLALTLFIQYSVLSFLSAYNGRRKRLLAKLEKFAVGKLFLSWPWNCFRFHFHYQFRSRLDKSPNLSFQIARMSTFVNRCPKCSLRCPELLEDVTRTPSFTILVEANQFTRKAAKDEYQEKVLAWANAAPPMNLSRPANAISPCARDQATCLMNGSLILNEKREFKSLDEVSDSSDDEATSNDETTSESS